MAEFSGFERRLARILDRSPHIKRAAKVAWQRLSYIRHRPRYSRYCHYPVESVGSPEAATFFGYYDHSPASPDGSRLIWHETDANTDRPPTDASSINIVLGDGEGTPLCSWSTAAFNWQQGARLQWLDRHTFLYNDFDAAEQRYVARVRDKEGHWLRDLPRAVYDASDPSGVAVSVNFERLAQLRPDYGYFARPNLAALQKISDEDDGLWVLPLDGNPARLAVSLATLAERSFRYGDQHKVNHPMLDPSGKWCVFLYRVLDQGRRHDSLWLLELATGALTRLLDTGMISHLIWYNTDWLIGYLRAADGKDGYYWLDRFGNLQPLAERKLDGRGDGHPSVNGRRLVTDSYPDKARLQHLRIVDFDTGRVEHIGSFFHGFRYSGPQRCDLHPRFSTDGQTVFLDSIHDGRRRLYRIDLRDPSD